MKLKLVIFRGEPASGKSTAFRALMKRKEMKDWVFVDHPALKGVYSKSSPYRYKEIAKYSLFAILRMLIEEKKNIVVEEMSRESIMKYLGNNIKKNKYEIFVFQFNVDFKKSYKRDLMRVKKGLVHHSKIIGKKRLKTLHKWHKDSFDKKGILVDCKKLNKKEVVELILKGLK